MYDHSVILTLASGLSAALVFGTITQRLGLSSLVGYMLAGIAVGPHTPGFVADSHLASQMADIGVILLMFGVGMHFHPEELLRVWRVALPGAAVQSALAVAAGWGCARLVGWSHGAAAVVRDPAVANIIEPAPAMRHPTVSTRRGPTVSTSTPVGNCITAYT